MLNDHPFRFGGANIYWLGLDENVGGIAYPTDFRIRDALKTALDMGVTVVRSHTLGISTGNPDSLEPSLGHFNSQAFRTVDYAVDQACHLGIRLIIPLTDNWHYYEGSYHDFTHWLKIPSQAFYTDQQAISAFEQYITVLLDHKNPYTGLELRNDPTIMAWELGNELNGMTPSWIDTIAAFIHHLAPDQLIAAGEQFGINPATLTAPLIDIVDAHFYPPIIPNVIADANQVTNAGKVFIAGEYGSIFANAQLFRTIEKDHKIAGWAFWSLFAHLDTYGYEQHNDGETLHYPGISPLMRKRDHLIRKFDYAIQKTRGIGGGYEPLEPPPGEPLITLARRIAKTDKHRSSSVEIAWRGTTDAATYSIERSTAGPSGPWSTVCNRCATDDSTPWTDRNAPATSLWYRVLAENEQRIPGTWSVVKMVGAAVRSNG